MSRTVRAIGPVPEAARDFGPVARGGNAAVRGLERDDAGMAPVTS